MVRIVVVILPPLRIFLPTDELKVLVASPPRGHKSQDAPFMGDDNSERKENLTNTQCNEKPSFSVQQSGDNKIIKTFPLFGLLVPAGADWGTQALSWAVAAATIITAVLF